MRHDHDQQGDGDGEQRHDDAHRLHDVDRAPDRLEGGCLGDDEPPRASKAGLPQQRRDLRVGRRRDPVDERVGIERDVVPVDRDQARPTLAERPEEHVVDPVDQVATDLPDRRRVRSSRTIRSASAASTSASSLPDGSPSIRAAVVEDVRRPPSEAGDGGLGDRRGHGLLERRASRGPARPSSEKAERSSIVRVAQAEVFATTSGEHEARRAGPPRARCAPSTEVYWADWYESFGAGACRNPLTCVRWAPAPGSRAAGPAHRPKITRTERMIDQQPTVVSLTDAAATKLRELTKEETNPAIGLRVYVYSGGCSGFRYGMMLEDAPTHRGPGPRRERHQGLRRREQHQPAPGLADRLRRHAHGRRLHRQQPERRRGVRLRFQLPHGGRRGLRTVLRPLTRA